MSFDQVAALPQFKDWFLDKDTPAISNFQEKIGDLTYRVTLFFYQDRLYRVDITTAGRPVQTGVALRDRDP